MRKVLFYSVLLLTLLWSTQVVAGGSAASPEACLECHDDVTEAEDFAASVHGPNGCVACHIELADIDAHMEGELMPGPVDCARCHKQEFKEYFDSAHNFDHPNINLSCTSCHTSIHDLTPWVGDKSQANATCESCHNTAAGEYHISIHSKGVAAGNPDSAACIDCHGLHAIASVKKMGTYDRAAFKTKPCMTCHADEEMMHRNEVLPVAVETYLHSYHGKHFHLGYPEKVAGCADCHTAHEVLPNEDPASSLSPDKLVVSCAQCHENASALFVKFYSHGDMTDSENYPILFYTYIAMSGLLVGTFGVFWFHSLLWMFRGFIENNEKKKALAAGAVLHHIDNPHKVYRRFTKVHIFMHLLVITSFLLLSLTGLPLKFADQAWAIVLMEFLGGATNAAFLHRIGAAITFVYFGMALFMSAKFLFYKLQYPIEFFHRLFGPESLCPNLRDIRDVTAMVRWFLFLGPKPTFERWTYWEKFDFMAVFWGIAVIGSSG
ncbi:MAG: cytochrome c3 family protein, partial [Desulfuromonadales bacterium]|nr:cytochrome c3 family protein [Desulfuromonadales bacterium]